MALTFEKLIKIGIVIQLDLVNESELGQEKRQKSDFSSFVHAI